MLVPDEVIVAMVAEAVAALDTRQIVLDGVPRTVPQALELDALMRAHARELTAARSG